MSKDFASHFQANIGKYCTIGFCTLPYEIKGYSSRFHQYLLQATAPREGCLFTGWVDCDRCSILPISDLLEIPWGNSDYPDVPDIF